MIEHIHTHRNLIGFDENGIPVVIHKASAHDPEQIDAEYRAVEEGENSGTGCGGHSHSDHVHDDRAHGDQDPAGRS